MKKIALFTASALALALSGCMSANTENTATTQNETTTQQAQSANAALSGTYQATLPCASCEGIDARIVLSTSGSYSYSATYLGKGQELAKAQEGTWQVSGQNVVLKPSNNSDLAYLNIRNGSLYLISPDEAGSDNPSISEQYRFQKQ